MKRRILLAAIALMPHAAVHAQPDEQINVICSAQAELCSLVQTAYAKSTGATVNMVQKSTGEALAQILAERSNPKTDVWFGGTGDPHMLAAEQDLTAEYKSPLLPKLHPWAQRQAEQSRFRTVALYLGPLGFAYNTEALARKKLQPPKTWNDLLKPEYKGEIQMGNPASSGTAYTVIATLIQLMGPDKAWDYLGKLHQNISEYQRSGVGPLKAVSRGEATISLSWLQDVPSTKMQGFPVEATTPTDGTGAELASMSIIKGARNLATAKKFYEWALTPAAQQFAYAARVYVVPSNVATPLDPKSPDLKNIRLIDYDYAKYGSAAERRRLILNWERRILNQSR